MLPSINTNIRDRGKTYVGDPAKDVGVEADMVFRDVKTALYEDFALQSAAVVYQENQNQPELIEKRTHLR
jgi:hypothetical protein